MEDEALTEEELNVKDDTEIAEEEIASESESESESESAPVEEAVDVAAKLTELEASNRGLVKSLSAQRGLRQELQGQLDGIKTAISEFKDRQSDPGETDVNGQVIPIDFDDDGNPYLDPANLGNPNNSEIEALKATINQLQTQVNRTAVQNSEQQRLASLLSERDGYADAHKSITKAWDYLKDDLFDAYLVEKGLEAPTNADQAIEMAVNATEITSKFAEKFPSLDMESVLEAHLIATPRYLRKALNKALVNEDAKSSHQSLDLSKPSSLARIDAGGGETQDSLLARVADMSSEDFMKLDATTMAKIDKLLESKG